MNWRKPVIYVLLYLTGSKIPAFQEDKLKKLLLHSYKNVLYYHRILREHDVINEKEEVNLDNFDRIPILTKDIIRREGENLYSKDYKKRKYYENTSGGSTGEPVKFIQDKYYDDWNIATKIYFNQILGKEIGEKEIKLWGSDRDIIMGNLTLKDRLINYLYNRKFFNSYNLNKKTIDELIKLNNSFKPSCYWSYVDAAFEFSKIALNKNIELFRPKFIITTIGPLFDDMRNVIEDAFKCPVYNQYGSREVGVIACQCKEKKHLHTFPWFNFVEVVDENDRSVGQGGEGKIVVTTLTNYSMPLIRYDIGDVAISANVLGRTLGYFKKADGSLVHSHFIVQSIFFKDWIKRFQIIQKEFDLILVNIELCSGIDAAEHGGDVGEIEERIKLSMGKDVRVEFRFVGKIEPSKSGKYIYTICGVKDERPNHEF